MTLADLAARLRAVHACSFHVHLEGDVVAVRLALPGDRLPVVYTGEASTIEDALADALGKAGLT